jgi:2-polyprenyl-6-methoxyphenol hydroxylase-like FAD-dependent oxidoreductase
VALSVLDRMSVLEEVRSIRTTMKGVSLVDIDGREVRRSEEQTASGGRFDAGDVEILRDDLAALLLRQCRRNTELVYGDSIARITDRATDVAVEFASGTHREFDLVVGADGLRSNVRNLVFGDDTHFVHSLGVGLAVFTSANFLDLRDWQIGYREGRGGFLVYTARTNAELRVAFGFDLSGADDRRMNVEEQKALVAARCSHYRWVVPRLIETMHVAPDFYFGSVAQVRMERWSKGRCALVGDAAYCPSPFSGQGTSTALVGAYVLAAELAKSVHDHAPAFERYQERMSSYVTANQCLARAAEGSDGEEALGRAKNAMRLD